MVTVKTLRAIARKAGDKEGREALRSWKRATAPRPAKKGKA